MKQYEYQGRTFYIEDTGECEITVSDGAYTVRITRTENESNRRRGYAYAYGFTDFYDSLLASTVEEAVEGACEQLLNRRPPVTMTPEDACRALSEFVENL